MAKGYIEREVAKERLRIWITDCLLNEANEAADCFRLCIDLLDSIPAADVVEVVRCCNCEFHDHDGTSGYCNYWRRWSNMSDFCSRGK